MKKSKSHSESKRKARSPTSESKRKSPKLHSKSDDKNKRGEMARKTRWESGEADPTKKTDDQEVSVAKDASSISEGQVRITDLLHDRERMVEYLFHTVTGSALEELIPDYLKKRSIEELKLLCVDGLKEMSEDNILRVISGKETSFPEKIKSEPDAPVVQTSDTGSVSLLEQEKQGSLICLPEKKSPTAVLESSETASDFLEIGEIQEEEDEGNQVPDVVVEEVAESLHLAENDADLLELEMRARAIRALLKAKCPEELDV